MSQILILALVVACISWSVTHEEIFKDMRNYCACKSKSCKNLVERKLFYLPICEYCFSHWVALVVMLFVPAHILYNDIRGCVLAFFSTVAVSNVYMTGYFILRQLLVYIRKLGKVE